LVVVAKLAATLNANSGGRFGKCCGLSGSHCCVHNSAMSAAIETM
jgi:hypothetical protein